MRVDASQVLAGSGVKVKSELNSVTDSLKEDNEEGVKTSADDDLSTPEKNLVRDFNDKSLAPFATKLAELNMPATEESARMMRDIMAQNPKLSMGEAAFLASNKLTGDESLMKAALDVLSGGDKTDAMIAKLISTLGEQDSDSGFRSVNAQNTAPLTEFITYIVKNATTLATIISQSDDNMQSNVRNTEKFFAQDVENVSSNNQNNAQVTLSGQNSATGEPQNNLINNLQIEVAQTGEQAPQTTQAQQIIQTQQTQPPQQAEQIIQQDISAGEKQIQEPAQNVAQSEIPVASQQSQESTGQIQQHSVIHTEKPVQEQPQVTQPQQNLRQEPPSTSNTVAQLLSQVPEFKGTPQSALEKFSNMLLRVAGDNETAQEADKDTKMLAAQLDKMFTKIGKNDADAGQRLREAREELFARLSLIEEEISKATGSAKTQMLSQTQKLMDHVKLLNNIEQFSYMQLPVQINEQRKAAELYIFKRKGGKRADPDNVNILLAIDLEFMGHWEALLNIKGKDVHINMEVQSEKEKDHFVANTVLLHEMLSEEGFKLVNTNIKISKEETTPLTALLAFDRYTGGHQGKIDFFY